MSPNEFKRISSENEQLKAKVAELFGALEKSNAELQRMGELLMQTRKELESLRKGHGQ